MFSIQGRKKNPRYCKDCDNKHSKNVLFANSFPLWERLSQSGSRNREIQS